MKQFSVPPHNYFLVKCLILGASPKVGSTSIERAIRQSGLPYRELQQVQVRSRLRTGARVLVFVRHPFDRLASAYWMFQGNRSSMPAVFADFVDVILTKVRKPGDEHWIPQHDYQTWNDTFLPTEVWPFEHIGELCRNLSVLGHSNTTIRDRITTGKS